MIKKAQISDLDQIMNIVKETVLQMNANNNYQWNRNYPSKENFIKDIQEETLFVFEIEGEVAGFTCINRNEAIEYKELNWTQKDVAYVVHRIAISPKYRNKGIAYKLMEFAHDLAKKDNVKHLKTDTYALNTKAQELFKKCGYQYVGEVNFHGNEKSFYCYEKVLVI